MHSLISALCGWLIARGFKLKAYDIVVIGIVLVIINIIMLYIAYN